MLKCECNESLKFDSSFIKNHKNCNYYVSIINEKLDVVCIRYSEFSIITFCFDYYNDYGNNHVKKYTFKKKNSEIMSSWVLDNTIFECADIKVDKNIENIPTILNFLKKIKDNLIFM